MNSRIKKIIARESLILLSISGIIGITALIVFTINESRQDHITNLQKNIDSLSNELDSLTSLPWNLIWESEPPVKGEVYNESNSPKKNLEYAIENNDSLKLKYQQINNLRDVKATLRPISYEYFIGYLAIAMASIFYVIRPIYQITKWSIKVLRE